jgi:hypothetical protein
MSYADLVLSDRPLGYWDSPQISRKNLLSENQYSLETSTSGWSGLSNSSISRVTSDSWDGDASLKITASSTSESGAILSAGSRVQLYQGRFYTMVARVKSVSGSRNASIRIQYYTTQNGSTESEIPRNSDPFVISNSEWTTIYHTEIVPATTSVNYFASWGVITSSGSSSDEIIVDGIQLFEGGLYQIYDRQYENDALLRYFDYKNTKPIIFDADHSVKLNPLSSIEISNEYKLFIRGAEDKIAAVEFWFSVEKTSTGRHLLLSIGSGISCYIEKDRVYIEYAGSRNFVRVSEWNRQHHFYFLYGNNQITLYLNNDQKASVFLGTDFKFDQIIDFIIPPIVIGPSSTSYNLVLNPSFEQQSDFWEDKDSTISSISSDSYSGSSCLKVVKEAVANSGCVTDAGKMLNEYKMHSLSAYIKIPEGQQYADIELRCNLYSSPEKTELTSTYSEVMVVEDSEWNRVEFLFTTDLRDRFAEIVISQPSAGTSGKFFLVDSVLLLESTYTPIWSETSYDSDPLFINGIALHSRDILSTNRQKRIDYATIDSDNQLAVEQSADIFDLRYAAYPSLKEVNLINEINISEENNVLSETNSIYSNPLPSESVVIGLNGGTSRISEYGLSFTESAYLPITQSSDVLDVNSSTIRMQTNFDTTTGNGYLLLIEGVFGYYGIGLRKYNNKIQGLLLSDYDEVAETLFETQSISSGDLNVALNLYGFSLAAKVGNQEFVDISIPTISEGASLTLGNIPETSNAYPDSIRNFAIDPLTDFENIDFIKTGKYMLRLTQDLNVSQRSEFNFSIISSEAGSNTVFTINTAGGNEVIINSVPVDQNLNIPDYPYEDENIINASVVLETDNSDSGYQSFNSAYLAVFDSSSLNSSLGNYTMKHNLLVEDVYQDIYIDEYGGAFKEPFVIQTINSNVLSHDDNLGIRFLKYKSTGCKIINNNSTGRCLEFVFKINVPPVSSELYNIFDLSGESDVFLKLNQSGLIKSGSYSLYIDGQQVSDISSVDIVPGEFYHIFVVFQSEIDSDIFLGKDKNVENCMDGSIGKLNMYVDVPANLPTFVLNKYRDILGRITMVVEGDSFTIRDSEATQQYSRSEDGSYYEMAKLPKVKIFDT